MGNVIAAQLVTGLMCLVSQFSLTVHSSAARKDVMSETQEAGIHKANCKHIRPCWDTAGGRNASQDEKETLWHLMALLNSMLRSSMSFCPLSLNSSIICSTRVFDEKVIFVLHLVQVSGNRTLTLSVFVLHLESSERDTVAETQKKL